MIKIGYFKCILGIEPLTQSIASVKSTALLQHFVTAKDIQVFSLAETYFPFVNDRCHL